MEARPIHDGDGGLRPPPRARGDRRNGVGERWAGVAGDVHPVGSFKDVTRRSACAAASQGVHLTRLDGTATIIQSSYMRSARDAGDGIPSCVSRTFFVPR